MKKKIKSLDQLQKERIRLMSERDYCKANFFNSMGTTQTLAKGALFKVGLSAGIMGLATVGIQKLAAKNQHKENLVPLKNKLSSLLTSILPLLLTSAIEYFNERQSSLQLKEESL